MNIIDRSERSLIYQSDQAPCVDGFATGIVELKARAPLAEPLELRIIMHPETAVDMLTRVDVRESVLMRYDGTVSCLGVNVYVDSTVKPGTFQVVALISQEDTNAS